MGAFKSVSELPTAEFLQHLALFTLLSGQGATENDTSGSETSEQPEGCTSFYLVYDLEGKESRLWVKKPLTVDELREMVGGTVAFAERPEDGLTVCVNDNGISEFRLNPRALPIGQQRFWGKMVLGKSVPKKYDNPFMPFESEDDLVEFLAPGKKFPSLDAANYL